MEIGLREWNFSSHLFPTALQTLSFYSDEPNLYSRSRQWLCELAMYWLPIVNSWCNLWANSNVILHFTCMCSAMFVMLSNSLKASYWLRVGDLRCTFIGLVWAFLLVGLALGTGHLEWYREIWYQFNKFCESTKVT